MKKDKNIKKVILGIFLTFSGLFSFLEMGVYGKIVDFLLSTILGKASKVVSLSILFVGILKLRKSINNKDDCGSNIPSISDDEYQKVANKNVEENISISSIEDLKVIKYDNELEVNTKEYIVPKLQLLNKNKKDINIDNLKLDENIKKLVNMFRCFNIEIKVVCVHVGPISTRYDIQYFKKNDYKKIKELNDEVLLTLGKKNVEIRKSIEEDGIIEIFVSNDKITPVSLYEVISSKSYEKHKGFLDIVLGKDEIGNSVIVDLTEEPHILMVGTTGTGKTNLINSIICSILMKYSPNEVELLLIDKKNVEFSCYANIPHLFYPVLIKDEEKLFDKVDYEIQKRYHMFSDTGTKTIEGFNEYVWKYNCEHPEKPLDKMPYIVGIIDEFADINIDVSRINKIIQNGRSVGFHLIISTQNITNSVVTDSIKEKVSSRIAFRVSNSDYSKRIIDCFGAEKLSGKGDMLYLAHNSSKPIKIQEANVTDDEILRIVDFINNQEFKTSDEKLKNEVINTKDELYMEIVDFVVKSQKASASLLQRKFRIGYKRATTLIDQLEEDGIIGPATGNSKPREVLYKYKD